MRFRNSETAASQPFRGARLYVLTLLTLLATSFAYAQQGADETLPIDMAMALRLADERNLDIAIFLERVAETTARLHQARTLAVPTLRIGTSYNRHSGSLQETSGQVLEVDRVSQFRGLGAGAVGAGDVQNSGLSLEVNVADAIFQRLVAEQNQAAAQSAAQANRYRVLLDVAVAYLELLSARTEVKIATDSLRRANELASVTLDYAEAGEGLLADAEMAAVQLLVWERKRLAAVEEVEVANAFLARLLHLNAGVQLEPLEESIPLIEIFSPDEDVNALIARALGRRLETEQFDALVAAAESDLTSEKYELFIPRVSLNYSSGDFGGAPGSSVESLTHRDDLALMLYWQFDQLGFGNRGRIDEKRSRLRQLELQRQQLDDVITAEVRESYARLVSLHEQMESTAMAAQRAERAYNLNRERIFENEGLPLEALQAMQALADVQLMNLDAVLGYSISQMRLHTALGNPVNGTP